MSLGSSLCGEYNAWRVFPWHQQTLAQLSPIPLTNETKEKLSGALKDFYKNHTHHNLGKKHSPETCNSKILTEKYSKEPNCCHTRSVICLNTMVTFERIVDANANYNISNNSITLCCSGRYLSAGMMSSGERMVWMYMDEYSPVIDREAKIEKANRSRKGKYSFNAKSVICLNTVKYLIQLPKLQLTIVLTLAQ